MPGIHVQSPAFGSRASNRPHPRTYDRELAVAAQPHPLSTHDSLLFELSLSGLQIISLPQHRNSDRTKLHPALRHLFAAMPPRSDKSALKRSRVRILSSINDQVKTDNAIGIARRRGRRQKTAQIRPKCAREREGGRAGGSKRSGRPPPQEQRRSAFASD